MRQVQIKTTKNFILRINKGEEVIKTIFNFCQKNKIFSGSFFGIGAADKIELGHYSVAKKQYSNKIFKGEHEVISINGIITDKKIHAHAAIADKKFNTSSGHLAMMNISGACEIHLIAGGKKISRKQDKETGLEILNI